jgi:putative Ca2+/H+ antiporter (TMEM165/GDT1 family)
MSLGVFLIAFAAIFVVELPDKTFIATLVLATRYKPLNVWIGVSVAFAVQTMIAIAVGGVVTLLPDRAVHLVSAAIFAFGVIVLLREGFSSLEETEEDELAEKVKPASGLKQIGISFAVLMVAEWGDLSQLLTISLVAKWSDALSVGIGAWLALVTVSGLAATAGKTLSTRIPVHVLHFVGAACAAGACVWTLFEAF